MTKLNIDTGTLGNPATGDSLRTAFNKINSNFEEVYQLVGDGSTGTITTTVTNGDLKLQANGTGIIEVIPIKIIMANLPTSDPNVAGQLFRSGNDLRISTG